MQLDFTQFMSTFEKTTKIRSMPHRDYVEWYIKAYYLPENSIEQFIREHTVYILIKPLIYVQNFCFIIFFYRLESN